MEIIEHPSPNHGQRRGGAVPDMVVLHYTGMKGRDDALARLCDPAAEVSAHYLIDESGRILRLVPEALRAWHAGRGAWGSVTDVNSRSIGIELVNPGTAPFPAPQMAALEVLLPRILDSWTIPPERVIGHACMAPARKADPGPRFDWRRLARAGLAIWPDPSPPADPARFATDAARFGYPPAAPDALLTAFRARFRPHANGPLTPQDAGTLARLAARWPAV
ncbi:MAG: N-acetylmuramoyl-L-alanine amidase [Alkalilacustris sp.]